MKSIIFEKLTFLEQENVIRITLEPITEESKAYIVDQRFMNTFLQEFTSRSFEYLQNSLKNIIDDSKDFQDLAINVENFMYLHKVANHPELKKPEVKEPVTNEFRKVGKISLDDVHGGLSQSEEDRHNEHLQNSMENQSTEQ